MGIAFPSLLAILLASEFDGHRLPDCNEDQVRQAGLCAVNPRKSVFSHLPPAEETFEPWFESVTS